MAARRLLLLPALHGVGIADFRRACSYTLIPRTARARHRTIACSTGSTEPSRESEERVVDVSEWLRTAPDDSVIEGGSDSDSENWEHEQRFARTAQTGQPTAHHEIRGALDPGRADILSAYSSEQGFREMTVKDLAELLAADPATNLIDVRSKEEFQEGHVPGAHNLSLDRLSEAVRAGELDPQESVAVICARGGRSAQACVRLSKVFQFAKVTNVKGGTSAWVAAQFPIEQASS